MVRKNDFPQRLRSLREKRHLSRHVLAELCGLSENLVAKYERGERFPPIDNLIILADFFDTSIDDIVGRK